ncbi:MAG: enoyl-CoA hydratase-related protein [Chloroflexi bacterium]|nr:enoyl-CoA hydratase-related protein [Chloroflexota bacterium]
MEYKTLQFECRDHIGWLTLNRPQRLNALSIEMVQELRHFFGSLDEHLEARVVVVRGAGRAFCAGFDVKELAESTGKGAQDGKGPPGLATHGHILQRSVSEIVIQMRRAPQPLIGAIRGPAAGGGFSLTMACDIRLAGQSARFNANNIRIGYSGGDLGSTYFLPRLIGLSRAAEYLYTGRMMDAATAERIGFVSRVVADEQLDQTAEELAREMLNATPFALRLTKELLNINIDASSLAAATELEGRSNLLCGFTEDAQEATKAVFFEKRPPIYRDA